MEENIVNSGVNSSYFMQKHSAMIRVWHWLTFLVIAGSMITVLLNFTLLEPRGKTEMVQGLLESRGATVTPEQAFAVSHEYEDLVWNVHKWFGITLACLLLSRMIIEVFQSREEKVGNRIRKAMGLYRQKNDKSGEYRHYLGVKFGYLLFYILLTCMALTGLGLAFGRNLDVSRELRGVIMNIHKIGQYCMYAFVVVHLFGVIIADNRKSRGIVSGMISGNK